jgi:sulfatase modifying factor 1
MLKGIAGPALIVAVLAAVSSAEATICRGDANCDGAINWRDIDYLVVGMNDNQSGWAAMFPTGPACPFLNLDTSEDGAVNWREIDPFVALMNSTCSAAIPAGMVRIAAGEFQMGNTFTGEGYADELPLHMVYLNAYYMDTCEVTNEQYAEALNWATSHGLITVSAGVVYQPDSGTSYPYCSTTAAPAGEPDYGEYSRITWDGSTFGVVPGREDHPVVLVSWYGAAAFANWRSAMQGRPLCYDLSNWSCSFVAGSYRLPTEAEWEKAARGGTTGRRFPWADADTIQHTRANYYSTAVYVWDTSPTRGYHPAWAIGSVPGTSPVGFFSGAMQEQTDWGWPGAPTSYQTANAANGYGLYDMFGNVWEWCYDWYDATYYGSSPYGNPVGPVAGTARMLRGGSWDNMAYVGRCANRNFHYTPNYRSRRVGFRLVLGDQ